MKTLGEWSTVRIDVDPLDDEACLQVDVMNDRIEHGLSIKFEAMVLGGYEKSPVDGNFAASGALEDLPLSVAIQLRDFLIYALRDVK